MSKVSQEVAEAEFARFGDAMDLDFDVSVMDDDDKAGFETQKRRVVRAIMKGSLVVNDKGEPVYTPQRVESAEPITFFEPRGGALMAMDRRKKNEDVAKMYALMGEMTKVPARTYSSMPMADLKVCQAVVTLFLA